MKLINLSLRGFRQHREGTFHFPDGLIGIIGGNGAGKTSVLEAICFALFGTKALRGKLEDVRTRGLGRRGSATEVNLLFEHDAVLYRVDRTLSECSFYIGGEPTPHVVGTREVTAHVASLLGMSYDEFAATYLTEQKGLEFLSAKKGATERERFIVRMMGYDKLERTQDLLRQDRRDKRARLSGLEVGLGTRDEIEARIANDRGALRDEQSKHDEAVKSIEMVERDLENTRNRFDREDRKRNAAGKVSQEIDTLRALSQERRRRFESLSADIEKWKAGIERAGLSESTEELRRVREDSERELVTVRVKELDLRTDLNQIEGEWRERLAGLKSTRIALEQQQAELKRQRQKFEAVSGDSACPTCSQPLGEAFHHVRHQAIDAYDAGNKSLQAILSNLKHEEEIPSTVVRLRSDLQTLITEKAKLQSRVHAVSSVSQELESIANAEYESKKLRDEQTAFDEERRSFEQKLTLSGFSEETFLREKGALEAGVRLLEVARLQRVKLEGGVRTVAALLKRTEDELVSYDGKTFEVTTLRRELLVLEESDRVLTDFRRHLNESIRPRLAELASEFLADLTDGRYVAVEIGEDFSPTVVDDGESKPIISGGEEDILNLCVRLALSNMLAERAGHTFSLLLLDEVFGSLDDNRRANVLVLLHRLRSRFDQIIIVTHLDDVKEGVTHLISVDYDEAKEQVVVRSSSEIEEHNVTVNL